MSTLEDIVTKKRGKGKPKPSRTSSVSDVPSSTTSVPGDKLPLEVEENIDRSKCVTLGASKDGMVVVGPKGFRKIFKTIEEAKKWLNN